MSRKKKLTARQKNAQRIAQRISAGPAAASDDLDDLTADEAYAEAVDWAKQQGIPEVAIERYGEAHLWAAENPDAADELVAFDENHWTNIMAGVVYPKRYGIVGEHMRDVAWQLRTWNILNGYKYCFSWTTPIAQMSEHDIIAQIREDAVQDGLTPEPLPEGAP